MTGVQTCALPIFKGQNLEFFDVRVFETDLRIGAQRNLYETALESVKKFRLQLETYISLHPEFLTSMQPLKPCPGAPEIIRGMCLAAEKAGVGPMAAVAGAVSEMAGRELLGYSPEIIVENGGDIFIKSNTTRRAGIYAGHSPFTGKLAVEITPERTPLGICTSSGSIGHSLSFGRADAAVVISRNTMLADAAATATGNKAVSPDHLEVAVDYAMGIEGVEGALVIIGDRLAMKGDIKLVTL